MVRVEAGKLTSIDLGKVLTIDLPTDQTLKFRMSGDLDRFIDVIMDWAIDAVEIQHSKAFPVVMVPISAGLRDYYATLTLLGHPITSVGYPFKLMFDVFVETTAWPGAGESEVPSGQYGKHEVVLGTAYLTGQHGKHEAVLGTIYLTGNYGRHA